MKSISINLQQWEVQAILEGRKTQLRRLVKPQPEWVKEQTMYWNRKVAMHDTHNGPFGHPGDILCFEETWQYAGWTEDGQPWIRYAADNAKTLFEKGIPEEWNEKLCEIWENLSDADNYQIDNHAADRRWRPPVTMPQWAVRLHGRVKRVWVHRLRAIEISDAVANATEFLDEFEEREPGSWERNDWVWACEFELEKRGKST